MRPARGWPQAGCERRLPLGRDEHMHAARALVWLFATGCSVGAPPGFSSGDRWAFPLVGPLEDGLLITPATVHGHGPYLFAIDPDATVSAVDKNIVDRPSSAWG